MQYFIFNIFFSQIFVVIQEVLRSICMFSMKVLVFRNFIDESVFISIGYIIVSEFFIISAFSKQYKNSSFSLTVF